jgi:K+-transporting ATPase ATPase A chain
MGPVASQEAIKMLGTNGGGFFNANSAHPFENPTPLVNFPADAGDLPDPGRAVLVFGRMVGDMRQGWAVLAAMTWCSSPWPRCHALRAAGQSPVGCRRATQASDQPGGNMEGKETRFGIAESALFATITTAASCGAVNSMHDSFTPLGGMVPLVLMQLGEVVFGGVGSGLYGMLVFAIWRSSSPA